MSDELENLTDGALSEVFAVEVAGWAWRDDHGLKKSWLVRPTAAEHPIFTAMPLGKSYDYCDAGSCIHFAASADDVLPWLHKAKNFEVNCYYSGTIRVRIRDVGPRCRWFTLGVAKAPTFARAACIALIRAARAQKGGAT